MTFGDVLSRRSFIARVSAAGGGLALAIALPFEPASAAEETAEAEITAWLVIHPDNAVVVRVARAEMGQGVHTALAMLVAEELECDWSKVRTELVHPEENVRRDRVWGDMMTGASRSIASSQLFLRQAGATAREMLDCRRGRSLESPGIGMRGANERHHAPAKQTHADVRRRRRGCGEAHASGRRRAERPACLEAHRQAAPAPRRARQGDRAASLRDRRAAAGDALRGHRTLPGFWRHAEVVRRRRDRVHEGRAQGGAIARCGRGGRGLVVASPARRRGAPSRLGYAWQRVGVEREHRRIGGFGARYGECAGRPHGR